MCAFQTASFWDDRVEMIDSSLPCEILSHFAEKMFEQTGVTAGNVLDVATGTGLIAFMLENKYPGMRITGVDYSPKMIEKAIRKRSPSSSIDFQVMDGQDLKFPDNTFDCVYVHMGVLYYSDIDKGLREIQRVLKPGGRASMSSWTRQFPGREIIEAAVNLGLAQRSDTAIVSLSDSALFEQKLTEAGFSSVKVSPFDYSTKVSESDYLQDFTFLLDNYKDDDKRRIIEEVRKGMLDENGNFNASFKANLAFVSK